MAPRHLVTSIDGREIGTGWPSAAYASWAMAKVAGRAQMRQERMGLVDGQPVPSAPAHASANAAGAVGEASARAARDGRRRIPLWARASRPRRRRKRFARWRRLVPTSLRGLRAGVTTGCGGDPAISRQPCDPTVAATMERRAKVTTRHPKEVNAARVSLPVRSPGHNQGRSPLGRLRGLPSFVPLNGSGRKPRVVKSAANWGSESRLLEPSWNQTRHRPLPERVCLPGNSIHTGRAVRDQDSLRLLLPPERGL